MTLELPWGLSTLLRSPKFFGITTFSPKNAATGRAGGRSLLKQPGMGKAQVSEKSKWPKAAQSKAVPLRKVNHQCLAILCCGSQKTHGSSASSAALPGNKTQKGPFLTTTSKCLSSFHHVWFGFEYSNIQAMNSWFFFSSKYSSHKLKK